MALNLGDKKGPISEINVTPLVDVMLVLLVIFMISAPLMFNGIKLDLPKTQKVNSVKLSAKQVIISLTPSMDYYIGSQKYLFDELVPEVKAIFEKNKTDVVFLRADFEVQYGHVAKLMSHLKRGGISKIALITEIEK